MPHKQGHLGKPIAALGTVYRYIHVDCNKIKRCLPVGCTKITQSTDLDVTVHLNFYTYTALDLTLLLAFNVVSVSPSWGFGLLDACTMTEFAKSWTGTQEKFKCMMRYSGGVV